MPRVFSFEQTDGKEDWLTPKYLVEALGDFDLDPCASVRRPWDLARTCYTKEDNGLAHVWKGRVWMNPPYGAKLKRWMRKMAQHKNGVALIFARTELEVFYQYIWGRADAALFLRGRLRFCNTDGIPQGTAGGPSVLLAYGERNVRSLQESRLRGFFIPLHSGEVLG